MGLQDRSGAEKGMVVWQGGSAAETGVQAGNGAVTTKGCKVHRRCLAVVSSRGCQKGRGMGQQVQRGAGKMDDLSRGRMQTGNEFKGSLSPPKTRTRRGSGKGRLLAGAAGAGASRHRRRDGAGWGAPGEGSPHRNELNVCEANPQQWQGKQGVKPSSGAGTEQGCNGRQQQPRKKKGNESAAMSGSACRAQQV